MRQAPARVASTRPADEHGNDRAWRLAGGGGMVEREDFGKTAEGAGSALLSLPAAGERSGWARRWASSFSAIAV